MSVSDVVVRPAKGISGTLRLPGDKSVSHRYAMLAAIAEGESRFQNFSTAADCESTLACLRQLGVGCEVENLTLVVQGKSPRLAPSSRPLDCGNSGSTMRLLSGILAGQPFASQMVGDQSLSRRPMDRIVSPLRRMGAHIASEDGRPPLHISPASLRGIHYEMPVPTAQVKTALLYAGLFAEGETTVVEPARTRDHGELALRAFGAKVAVAGRAISIIGRQQLQGIEATVPGDLSTAAFFMCAAALFPGSQLTITSLLLNPTRAAVLDLLLAMGARVSVTEIEEVHGELAGTVLVQCGELKGGRISGAMVPALIDELPVLAAIAPYTSQGIEIRDAQELRVKESDRLAAVTSNLQAMGAEVESFTDGVRIPGRQVLHGAELDSFGDHRIAMAFAIAALRATGDSVIHHADCARISFPDFFDALETLAQR
ncbi:MAG: 3-phosphoshikimate 1-carboxyvinyltransferase [Acidobacteriales bacterium]|nr:3-phosphoshikimate 1-carboxyvinyltransferase [Terriglobales bacterium]